MTTLLKNIPTTPDQCRALVSHLEHSTGLLARPDWLRFDKRRRPALEKEVVGLKARLFAAAAKGVLP